MTITIHADDGIRFTVPVAAILDIRDRLPWSGTAVVIEGLGEIGTAEPARELAYRLERARCEPTIVLSGAER